MNLLKISSLIIFYFFSRIAFSANCESYRGMDDVQTLCWNEKIQGWVSKVCDKEKCEALKFFNQKMKRPDFHYETMGQNPAAMSCRALKLGVRILKDSKNNQQSFCLFGDNSLADSNAIEGHLQ